MLIPPHRSLLLVTQHFIRVPPARRHPYSPMPCVFSPACILSSSKPPRFVQLRPSFSILVFLSISIATFAQTRPLPPIFASPFRRSFILRLLSRSCLFFVPVANPQRNHTIDFQFLIYYSLIITAMTHFHIHFFATHNLFSLLAKQALLPSPCNLQSSSLVLCCSPFSYLFFSLVHNIFTLHAFRRRHLSPFFHVRLEYDRSNLIMNPATSSL